MKNKFDKRLSHENFDWKGHRQISDINYEKALHTGDLNVIKSHNILQEGEKDIAFAISLAEIYFGTLPKGKALDVACGCGYLTSCLQKAGFDSIGFDISEEAITLAKQYFPNITFFCGDGTKPSEYFCEDKFNLIHIREFHPFTRVNDFDFQIHIIMNYLEILNRGGFILIVHSRRHDFAMNNIKKVQHHLSNLNIKTMNPLYFFPHKHTGIPPRFKILNSILSFITKIYARISNRYPVEFFLIHKP